MESWPASRICYSPWKLFLDTVLSMAHHSAAGRFLWLLTAFATLVAAISLHADLVPSSFRLWPRASLVAPRTAPAAVPDLAQFIDQRSFNALDTVAPPAVSNGSSVFVPPGHTTESLLAKPFHIYDDSFLGIIGSNPTLTLIAETETDPLFHEAVVWVRDTDEVFFAQNAGAVSAGTGLAKSAIIQKISLANVTAAVASGGFVQVDTVDTAPQVINPNGATNYRGQLVFAGEGQGENIAPALFLVNPYSPYNTTVLLNNFFGRQFNAPNDVAVHPVNKDLYFTDPDYGYLQDFRPAWGLPRQVYRFDDKTGAVTVVADGLGRPNGLVFSPDGAYAYVTDTGRNLGFYGYNFTEPASIYRYNVASDGTFENRKIFTYVDVGVPDGVHVDTNGNVYAGCGDGVRVWNPSGKLLGTIFLGTTSANFQFAGAGRMIIGAETKLYYVTLAAAGDRKSVV